MYVHAGFAGDMVRFTRDYSTIWSNDTCIEGNSGSAYYSIKCLRDVQKYHRQALPGADWHTACY
jgi:hypothetical protein